MIGVEESCMACNNLLLSLSFQKQIIQYALLLLLKGIGGWKKGQIFKLILNFRSIADISIIASLLV